jgi:hypothetical protein
MDISMLPVVSQLLSEWTSTPLRSTALLDKEPLDSENSAPGALPLTTILEMLSDGILPVDLETVLHHQLFGNSNDARALRSLSRGASSTTTDTLLGQASKEILIGILADEMLSRMLASPEPAIAPRSRSIPPGSTTFSVPAAPAFELPGYAQDRTYAFFDLDADLTRESRFYNLPYPLDLRLDEAGRPDMSGYPIFNFSPIASNLKAIVGDRIGFPVNTPGYFRFNEPLMPQDPTVIIPALRRSPVWLLDVDPNSPDRGKLFPTVASTFRSDDYAPKHLLGIAPAPGIVLSPNRTYAYVVKRSLKGSDGRLLGVAPDFAQLREGLAPAGPKWDRVKAIYQPLWETLDGMGINRRAIAAATVFTTGDVVGELAELSDRLLNRYDLSIDNLTLDLDTSGASSEYYTLRGTIDLPQFQTSDPPFDAFGGRFEFTDTGIIIEQGIEVDVPIILTLPKTRMPEGGYPLMVYYHGSNGLSTQVIDRGPITEQDGEPTPGLGPAHVMAQQGFAALGMALPQNPERAGGSREDAYFNPLNLAAYRDTFRQGTIEQRLILEAIANLEISPSVFTGVTAPPLPPGQTHYRIQTDSIAVMGQSHGAQYANMVGAVEPKVGAVVPTGSGGFWSLLVAETSFVPFANILLGTFQSLNPLHPALTLLQTAWEAAEPIVYAPRLGRRPLPNHPARSVYIPVGKADPEFPEFIFDAMALASGVKQAGDILWPEMQESLALEGFDGIQPYLVANNLTSENGNPYTGVVVQYAADKFSDSHDIFVQLDEVKRQYAYFFKSFVDTQVAIVPDPYSVTA